MKKAAHVGSADDIETAAADWLARLDRPDLPAAVHGAFEAWCQADPRHLAAYLRVQSVWSRLGGLKALGSRVTAAAPVSPPVGAAVPHPPPPSRLLSGKRLLPAAIAAALLCMAAGLWLLPRVMSFGPATAPQSYATALGGFTRITLADGSVIQLNTNSELHVTFRKTRRELELIRGEATFDVTPDKSRPFIVTAGNTAVRALGTSFDIHEMSAGVEVLIMAGTVAVGSPEAVRASGAVPILAAGQVAVASHSQLDVNNLDKAEVARRLAWQRGMLGFSGQRLAEVAAEFNRYNESKLVVADPAIAQLHIGGNFRATNVEAFVEVLEERFGIVATHEPGRIVLLQAPRGRGTGKSNKRS